ncbi:MAG TPA: dipeptide/oligopeptide/nickel ABC transporter permease/ATP-binding protein [Streptosporangiaceae bacterium]
MSEQVIAAETTVSPTGDPAAGRARRRLPATLIIGIIVLGLMLLLAIFGPVIWGSQANNLGTAFRSGPTAAHLLGTDALGRDDLARTLSAARLTIWMAFLATLIAVGAGIVLGAAIVVAGPRVRATGERLIDLLIAYPPIIVALAVTAIFRPSETSVVVAIGLAFTPQFARLTNTLASSVSERDFVWVAQLLGLRGSRVLRRHILPNLAGPLLVLASVGFASAIITLSGLSFIGLGVQQPTYDWGALLASGLQDLNANPIEVVGPALGILITGLAAGLVGDGLNHYLDPRLRVSFRRRRQAAAAVQRVALGVPSPGPQAAGPADPGLVASVSDLRVFAPDAPEAPIVRGVSLQIRRGEIVGLVGESGSGKTMTAMGIARLLPAGLLWDAAELTVSGRDVSARSRSTRHLATEVGIVFQDPSSSFNPARHIGPQITETARVHGGMGKQQANALAIDRLRESHVSSPELRMRQYPHELSGGMRQRAMIAMALMTSPSLLIADEPTTALDVTVQADVLRLLRNLNQSHGMAVLLISHDIAVVSALCDRVCVMYAGRIVEELSAADLHAQRVCHPYTRALLAASPRLEAGADGTGLTPLEGRPPRPGIPISGCSFADRCSLAIDECRETDPELRDLGEGRRAACLVTTGPLGEATSRA